MLALTPISRSVAKVAVVVCLQLMAGCGGGSGGSGSGGSGGGQPPPPPSNPSPAIVSLSPGSTNAGGSALTITITGYNFLPSSTAQWNGSQRATTYTSSTQLQAQITAADIANAGSAQLSVTNPTPGGGNSGSAEFTINPTFNPAPAVLGLYPNSANVGTSDFVLNVTGSNFVPSSVIEWNGTPIPTTFLENSVVVAQVPDLDLASSGVASVAVMNPGPGGGTTTPLPFAINYQPMVVNQLANDLIWDANSQLIYLSVPSLAGSNGNTIAALNPLTGAIVQTQFAGSEPDVLAMSDDSQFLYSGIDGSASVQRFLLPGLTPDISYPFTANALQGTFFGFDLQVAPGLSHTTAVSRGNYFEGSASGGMAIFDDATQRTKTATQAGSVYDSLAWASDSTIYAINSEITSFDLYALNVNASGVSQTKDYLNEFYDFYVRMHYVASTGLVYIDDGNVIDPTNGQHITNFQASGYMVPDATLNRAFFLGQIEGVPGIVIESFNLTTYAPIAEIIFSDVQGNPLRFIRWGTSGLAFNDDAGFVYIINDADFVSGDAAGTTRAQRVFGPVQRRWTASRSQLRGKSQSQVRTNLTKRHRQQSASAAETNPAPQVTALNPSAVIAGQVGLTGFTLTVTGSNFVSLSTVEWNGSALPTELVSSTELQAQISLGNVETAGSASVTVYTPSPGGGTSNALTLNIVEEPVPQQSIIAVNPNSATAGSGELTIQLSGVWLEDSDTVLWNGNPLSNTSYGGIVQAQVSAADLATPGYGQVAIQTPEGQITNAAEFQILYQPAAVNQSTTDMVWDPVNQVFYISVPASASTNANQVCILNPTTLAITNCQAGNEPDVLAISDDSQYLYAGMDGTGSVQRFVLPGLTPDISFSLGAYEAGIPYFALDLQVAPGAPHTVAASRGVMNLDPDSEGGIAIYDDGVQRPTIAAGWGPTTDSYDSLQWGADASTLYAANTEGGGDFYSLTVSPSGVSLDEDYPSVFWNPGRIHYDSANGLIYSDDGFHAINPATALPTGLFEVGGGWPMAPDSTTNTVFILAQYVWQENSNFTIDLFDMEHYVLLGEIPFSTTAQSAVLGRFLRWGSNGLAVNFQGDQIYLLTGSFISNPQAVRARHNTRLIQSR
jgi:trimeric autotransporter adhesin